MKCPKCHSDDTRVVDSRTFKDGRSIRRRRLCQKCNHRFSTLEEILREGLMVRKRDGSIEEFDLNKMIKGIRIACQKRPIDLEQLDMLASDVVMQLENDYDQAIPSEAIGKYIMNRLKKIDQIAYVRFASVYKDFRDIAELETEISQLKKENV